ncbi:MAG: hypothetical protein GVY04_14970 [Cyanobacteria bacterium]|jgi:hypothetical protein|nr:hypothetical protein [Cyanobacteria bacterium GSL.Bin1]
MIIATAKERSDLLIRGSENSYFGSSLIKVGCRLESGDKPLLCLLFQLSLLNDSMARSLLVINFGLAMTIVSGHLHQRLRFCTQLHCLEFRDSVKINPRQV